MTIFEEAIRHYKLQGINKLINKHKISRKVYLEVLELFFVAHVTKSKRKHPFFSRNQNIHNLMSEVHGYKFPKFLELLTHKTGITFKKKPESNYHSDWNESNENGDFAYNNAADDF